MAEQVADAGTDRGTERSAVRGRQVEVPPGLAGGRQHPDGLECLARERGHVGLARPAGGFDFLTPQDHPVVCCWSTYRSLLGDFNRDRVTDMLWINRASVVHRANGTGPGRFSYVNGQDLGGTDQSVPGAGLFEVYTGDVDGDGSSDVIWNRINGSGNRVAITRGTAGQSVLDRTEPAQMHPDAANWLQAQLLVGDFNGDRQDDVLWVIPGGTTRIFLGVAKTPST